MRAPADPALYPTLKRRDAIRITFGGSASQLAIVHKVTREGNVHVFKFSATRGIWKGPIRLYVNEVIAKLTPAEVAQYRAPALPEGFGK